MAFESVSPTTTENRQDQAKLEGDPTSDVEAPLNYFDLPFFNGVTFTVLNDAQIKDLAVGAYMLLDIAGRLSGDQASDEPHAVEVLIRIASAAVVAIGCKVDPNFGWAGLSPSRKAEVDAGSLP